ncbi:MAG: SDR family NAD(P)-dependent oxidoreductase [Candidatus Limnocylindria bacterium]
MQLDGKTILVTGGGHGIGRAYCHRIAAEGGRVGVLDIDGEAARAVAAAIGERNGAALALETDVTDLTALETAAGQLAERFGAINGLVNNAGMLTIRPISRVGFELIPDAEWDELFRVNVKGTWHGCRAAAPHLRRAGGGSIVNIGSGTFYYGSPTRLHYVASKGAVIAMTRVLSRELGSDAIRVNTLVPGSTLSEDDPSPEIVEMRKAQLGNRSLKRVELPEDLVGALVFLLSDDSRFVTGQALVVEGGGILH